MRDGVPSTPLGAVRVSPAAELLRVGDNVAPRAIDPSSRTPAASSRTSTRRWQRVCVCFCLSLCLSLCLCVLAHNKRFLFRASHRRRPVANCLPRRPFTRFLIHCFSLSLTNSQMKPGKIACPSRVRAAEVQSRETRAVPSTQKAAHLRLRSSLSLARVKNARYERGRMPERGSSARRPGGMRHAGGRGCDGACDGVRTCDADGARAGSLAREESTVP